MPERAIIHINVADFAVAVERAVDGRLADRPVIIAPEGAPRAAVYDMSEEAYRAGVRKGMALALALRRCRDARVLPPHPERYEQAMGALLREALPYSPLVESGDDDGHLFADVTGTHRLFGHPVDVAWRLGRRINGSLGLDPIWSLAPNKLVAKVATRLVKPTGEYIVGAGEEETFLSPLPLNLIPGLEVGDVRRLGELNITRVHQAAALEMAHLEILFPRRAPFVYEAVRGIDASPVLPAGQKPPAVTAEWDFGEDTNDAARLAGTLYRLVESAGRQLRTRRLAARRVAVMVDYSDGVRRIRQAAHRPATANDICLFDAALGALRTAAARRVRVRHLRLRCDRLTFPPAQLALFPADRETAAKRTRLVAAIDAVRTRFGPAAIQVGRAMAA
jgi:DNA polymerase-4